jgi:hypothetical protein
MYLVIRLSHSLSKLQFNQVSRVAIKFRNWGGIYAIILEKSNHSASWGYGQGPVVQSTDNFIHR